MVESEDALRSKLGSCGEKQILLTERVCSLIVRPKSTNVRTTVSTLALDVSLAVCKDLDRNSYYFTNLVVGSYIPNDDGSVGTNRGNLCISS